jgi:hypothetical protein
MASDRQRYALQVIFSFFLGLMVVAFIGVGVNTFFPPPESEYQDRLEDLERAQEDIEVLYPGSGELTEEERAEIQGIREEIRELEEKQQEEFETWARNTSIILILFATLIMGISLVRSEQLRIISNGLLLGGVFTMLYGTGWVIAAGSSVARFAVMTFALVVTFALGYVRFVRGRKTPAPAAGAATPDVGAVAELEDRVGTLERQLSQAANALGRGGDSEDSAGD